MAKTGAITLLLLLSGCASGGPAPGSGLRIAVFASDVTPPIGHPLIQGITEEVLHPLLLKGIVLDDGRSRVVLAAIDWCALRGGAYDQFRERIAAAAGIPVTQVAVQSVHTHSAPYCDARAETLIAATAKPFVHLDLQWLDRITTEAARSVETAVHNLQPITHVGVGQAKVEHFASNRRVKGPDGKIRVRYAATKDPTLAAEPEGLIDPWLKTVSFYNGDETVVRLHYYASHPQSYYSDGKAHPDTPGLARTYVEDEEGVSQIYFTGCAGDVTAGKYNNGSPEARLAMSKQLYSGMIRAIKDTKKVEVSAFSWKTVDVALPLRGDPAYSEAALRARMENVEEKPVRRNGAAMMLAWIERARKRPSIDVSRLRLGPVDILHLPGEPFVEFQLYAQSQRPDRFVAVAGYGEGGPGYLCTDAALPEGGYEPTATVIGEGGEPRLKAAIAELLK